MPDNAATLCFEMLIKRWEGYRSQSYIAPEGHWTVGFGTCFINGRPVQKGETVTLQDAELLALERIESDQKWIIENKDPKVQFNDHELAALSSWTYNFNIMVLKNSSLWSLIQARVRHLNLQNLITNAWLRWDHYYDPHLKQMMISPGLAARRKDEADLFFSPMPETLPPVPENGTEIA